jgi:hypothetical protein
MVFPGWSPRRGRHSVAQKLSFHDAEPGFSADHQSVSSRSHRAHKLTCGIGTARFHCGYTNARTQVHTCMAHSRVT